MGKPPLCTHSPRIQIVTGQREPISFAISGRLLFTLAGTEKKNQMSNSIPSKVLPNVAPSQMSKLALGKLTRDQMATLLHACYNEQRAPMMDELHAPTNKKFKVAYTAERTGTGLFDLLDNDALAEVLFRLPIQQRIVFAKRLCKQFAGVAHEHKVFKALCVSPFGHINDTKEEANNSLYIVGNWRFLTKDSYETQIEELKLRESHGRTVEVPPKNHLQRLTKLSLQHVSATMLKRVRQSIDASKLKELHVFGVKGANDLMALLKQSTALERLSLFDIPPLDISKIIDAWREVHGGYPPLRSLSIGTLGHKVMMHDLEKLDLDEIHCYHVSEKIGKAHLPSMRTLRVRVYHFNATKSIPSLKALVESCPCLQTLILTRPQWEKSEAHGVNIVADAMKKEFPRLSVEVVIV